MATGMTWIARATANGVSTISFDNVFTTTYDFYCIVGTGNVSSAAYGVLLRMRVGGVDATGANYERQRTDASNTTLSSIRLTNSNTMQIGAFTDTMRGGFVCEVAYPALAQQTGFETHLTYDSTGSTLGIGTGVHAQNIAYDGCTIYMAAGDFTDAVFDIYGYGTT